MCILKFSRDKKNNNKHHNKSLLYRIMTVIRRLIDYNFKKYNMIYVA